jgi:hypothetical protein
VKVIEIKYNMLLHTVFLMNFSTKITLSQVVESISSVVRCGMNLI